MPSPEIYYSHTVIYFLQTCRKRLLPVLKELAGSQGFNDWGLVQWWGGEARGSVRIPPPPHTPGDLGRMTHIHRPSPHLIHIIIIEPFLVCALPLRFFLQFLLFLSLSYCSPLVLTYTQRFPPLIPLPLFFSYFLLFCFSPLSPHPLVSRLPSLLPISPAPILA